MDTWNEELSRAFLPLEFTAFSTSTSNLLIKLLHRTDPQELCLLATDLRGVYYEGLKGRQLVRRVEDTVSSSSESQAESLGVIAGVGEEGVELVRKTIADLVDAVRSGRGKAAFKEGFEQFIDITLPNDTGVFRFVPFRLESESAACLASQLIQPLLGTSTALLSLLRQAIPDEAELIAKLEPAIDSSGRAERLSEGRSASTFFRIGGSGLLKRWEQSMISAKSKNIDPLQLALPAPRSARPSPKKVLASNSKVSSPNPTSSPASSPRKITDSPSKRSGLASKMLDHRTQDKGEKVGWEDSQPEVSSSRNGKGREVERDVEMRDPERDEEELAEPPTDDEEDESPFPLSLPKSSQPDPPSARSPSLPPAPSYDPSQTLAPSNPSGSRPSPPPPHPPVPSQEDLEEKQAKKKRKAEQEEAEELERRKAKFAKMKAGGGGKKKKSATKGL
ncbi:hypothetical protein JCM5353_008712 [Sporobolomyces roseus]